MKALSHQRRRVSASASEYTNGSGGATSVSTTGWIPTSPSLNSAVLEAATIPTRRFSRFGVGTFFAFFLKSKRKESWNQSSSISNQKAGSLLQNVELTTELALEAGGRPSNAGAVSLQNAQQQSALSLLTSGRSSQAGQRSDEDFLKAEYCVPLASDHDNSETLFNHGLAGIERVCRLPKGVNYYEWVVSNECSFFANINLVYHSVREFCTSKTCPRIDGYDRQSYWLDSKGRKVKCNAQQYIDFALEYVDRILSARFQNEDDIVDDKFDYPYGFGTFRTIDSASVPKYVDPYTTLPIANPDTLQRVVKSLLRTLCHIYRSHFDVVCRAHLYAHLNSVFLHFMVFNLHFKFLETRDSEVLDGLFHRLLHQATQTVIDQNKPTALANESSTNVDGTPSEETKDPQTDSAANGRVEPVCYVEQGIGSVDLSAEKEDATPEQTAG